MKFPKVLELAESEKLLVNVTYELGKKELGDYIIEYSFPHTLLLLPQDTYGSKIWVPNPMALEPRFIVTTWDDKHYNIKIYEQGEYDVSLIWKLTFNSGDLLCLT